MSTLTIALEKVDFLPPTRVTDDTSVLTLKNLVFEPLLKWQDGSVRPALFESWTHSADGREWTFSLREGATFHDGVPCTAHHVIDFVSGILDAVDTFGMKWSYARYLADARISAEGDGVVRVENPRPLADVLDIFSEFYICRLTDDGQPVLGTGRYRVAEFEAGRRAVLERAGGPAGGDRVGGPGGGHGWERIVALAERGAEERLASLRCGEVDAALNLERVEGRLAFDEDVDWSTAVNTLSVMAYLNCQEGIFRSPKARLAVNHAVDTVALATEVFHGLAVPSATVAGPFHLGTAQAGLEPVRYDPDTARRLLDEAGTGGSVRLRTPTFMPERAPETSHFIAASLEAVGLDVTVETERDRPEYARQVGRKEIGDMAVFDSSPHSTYRILNDKISSATRAVWWQGFDDEETERLIGRANSAVSHDARRTAYARCLRRLHENPPWLYLVHPVEVLGTRTGVAGLSIDHKGTLTLA
ncbi:MULTISPECIES: ABC transporter substrate-binding protein [unclassified Streptomyces]|uniref:ABC transporter substrate-binding protein n=1 Tax=unclassified Streptomyces TaxID=2593676 RepID=UPI0036E59493